MKPAHSTFSVAFFNYQNVDSDLLKFAEVIISILYYLERLQVLKLILTFIS